MAVPAPQSAPAWANELALAYESGASSQFILFGNVHDRLAVGDRLVSLADFLEDTLLKSFGVVLSYDLGSGLNIERGGDIVAKWKGAELKQQMREPLQAVQWIDRYLRYLGNLRAVGNNEKTPNVAVILRSVDHIVPADGAGFEHGSITSMLRAWSCDSPFVDLPFASLLIADNLNDVEPLIASAAQTVRTRVPLPDAAALELALGILRKQSPKAFAADANLAQIAGMLTGVTVSSLDSLTRIRHHEGKPLADLDLARLKKDLVERDSAGLVEFIEPKRTLNDYHGQDALKAWLRQDIVLWRAGDLKALPMGYLLCGPVGTGKTFLVECLAGEAGVPVVKLKNFRDRWVGSSEGNLEKIFRLIRALGRCMVFIDEADQTLGKRDSGANDSGLSGRIYSMIAQEMSDSGNRGRVLWLLASSRPDLIEVDLKRPGRIDVKVPLLPTSTPAESAQLIATLAKRYGLEINAADLTRLEPRMPTLLTPGAAEALVVKAYRHARTQNVAGGAALEASLTGYQNPVPADVLEFQMRIAIREATDLGFVPPRLSLNGMKNKPSYLAAAFNARPLGMPIPPNWFGIATFGLLGALINPGLWLIGLGAEGFYLWWLSKSQRFRNTVDAAAGFTDSTSRYENLLAHLDSAAQSHQYEIEQEAAEIVQLLQRSEAHGSQIGDVRQMAWLHLKLLAARAAFAEVVDVAGRERKKLEEQERRCKERLAATADDELRRSLEQQIEVINSRRAAHADAERRMELVDAELGRLRQQVSLVREQALLVTEEGNIGQSLDALSASLNEANRWLKDQRELFAGLDNFTDEPPPADLLASKRGTKRATKVSE